MSYNRAIKKKKGKKIINQVTSIWVRVSGKGADLMPSEARFKFPTRWNILNSHKHYSALYPSVTDMQNYSGQFIGHPASICCNYRTIGSDWTSKKRPMFFFPTVHKAP